MCKLKVSAGYKWKEKRIRKRRGMIKQSIGRSVMWLGTEGGRKKNKDLQSNRQMVFDAIFRVAVRDDRTMNLHAQIERPTIMVVSIRLVFRGMMMSFTINLIFFFIIFFLCHVLVAGNGLFLFQSKIKTKNYIRL